VWEREYRLRYRRPLLQDGHQKVLHHRHQRPFLRYQGSHLLRQYGLRTEGGLLPRQMLRAWSDLRRQTLLVVGPPGLAAWVAPCAAAD